MNGYCQTRRSQSSLCKAVDKRQREAENNQAAIIVLFRWLVEMPSSPTLMAVISVGSGDRCFSRMDRRPSKPGGSVSRCVPSSSDSFRCLSSSPKFAPPLLNLLQKYQLWFFLLAPLGSKILCLCIIKDTYMDHQRLKYTEVQSLWLYHESPQLNLKIPTNYLLLQYIQGVFLTGSPLKS